MRSMRRRLAPLVLVAACGGDADGTYEFGPFELAPGEEVTDRCVQISLENDAPLYVNAVELTTGPGFHHSNWFFVPEHTFFGDDGTFRCADRAFNEAAAAINGGVLFAQSTQAPHEIQQFPAGVAVKVPPHSKLVTQIHLLNSTEQQLTIRPTIRVEPLDEAELVTTLAAMSFEDHALVLPPAMGSKFTVECDLAPLHNSLLGRDPDFKLYYGLAHYHELGTGFDMEAVRTDGTAATIYSTSTHIGDTLGGPIAPAFDMTGFTKLRFSCSYFNPRATEVRWGVGDQEMCVFLAFTDSTYLWGGGFITEGAPENPVQVGDEMHYTNPCQVYANDATR
jgi:hypothetical protein